MSMKIYISGKITGDPLYKNKFTAAATKIKAAGHTPVNPADINLGELATWSEYMRTDIKLLCDCEGMYMLKDWTNSEGAKVEHELGKKLGLRIMYEAERTQDKKQTTDIQDLYEKQKEINKELVDENEELKVVISKMEKATTEKNSEVEKLKTQIEKMKSDLKNLDTSGTKGFVLERFWDLLEKWEIE